LLRLILFSLCLDYRVRMYFMVHCDSLIEFPSVINEDCSSSLFSQTSYCVSICLCRIFTSLTWKSIRTQKVSPVPPLIIYVFTFIESLIVYSYKTFFVYLVSMQQSYVLMISTNVKLKIVLFFKILIGVYNV